MANGVFIVGTDTDVGKKEDFLCDDNIKMIEKLTKVPIIGKLKSIGNLEDNMIEAIKKQIDNIEHVIFANFSNKPAIELAEKLVNIALNKLKKVFFSDNGSSAVEIALKMSFHYNMQKGKNKKRRFVALSDAYHGETLGALSVCDKYDIHLIVDEIAMGFGRTGEMFACNHAQISHKV